MNHNCIFERMDEEVQCVIRSLRDSRKTDASIARDIELLRAMLPHRPCVVDPALAQEEAAAFTAVLRRSFGEGMDQMLNVLQRGSTNIHLLPLLEKLLISDVHMRMHATRRSTQTVLHNGDATMSRG